MTMVKEEIFGRSQDIIDQFGKKATAYFGKIVSYPAGKYEEVGSVYIDLGFPHCMLVVGKRGTGKSYTLGVLAEGFAMMEENEKKRISVIIIDTMSVFHSLKTPNTNNSEVNRLKDFQGLEPRGFSDIVKVFIPKISIDMQKSKGNEIFYDNVLQLPLCEVEISDWLSLFDLKITDPVGTLLSQVIGVLKKELNSFSYDIIYQSIEHVNADEKDKRTLNELFHMIEEQGLFGEEGTPLKQMVKGGQLSVLDISYLGRMGDLDLRNIVVKTIAEKLMKQRTLHTTMEMQSKANLISQNLGKNRPEDNPIVYLIMDEAHLFLPSDASTISSNVLIDWVKLGRHPGLSTVFCTQEPSALHDSVIRQSDLLIAHNVTSRDDVDALGKAKQTYMSSSKDIQKVVSEMEFKKGLVAIFDDKTRRMELCRVRPRLSLHTGMDASVFSSEDVIDVFNRPPSPAEMMRNKRRYGSSDDWRDDG